MRISDIRCVSGGLLLGLVHLSPGCMHSELSDPNPYISVTQEKDIPAPRDFQFDKDRSFTYTLYRDPKGVGSFRTSTLYYYGDQQVGKLVPWYLEQMKADGWGHKETSDNQDKRCLTFTKGSETATVLLYREFDPRMDRYLTFVQAEVHPTRTEEMASEDLLNAPILPDRSGRAEGTETTTESPSPSDEEIESRVKTGGGDSGIIMDSPGGGKGIRTAVPSHITRETSEIGAEGNKQVVNEEVGAENNEENAEETPAEDEESGK